MAVELTDVEAFLVLAEELHFGRTAERTYVTTGRVSQRIQALERELGGALFERTSRRVVLTPLGRQASPRQPSAWCRNPSSRRLVHGHRPGRQHHPP